MNNFQSRILGQLAIFIGVCVLFGIVFYTLSFHVYNIPLLKISAVLILVGVLLDLISGSKAAP
jgi:hypothetical protein